MFGLIKIKKSNYVRILLGLVVLTSLLLFTACGSQGKETPSAKDNKENGAPKVSDKLIDLRVGVSPDAIDHVTVFAAADKGIFEKHGLNVKLKTYATGVELVNALQAGDVDVSVLGVPPFLSAASKGIPLVLISANHGKPETNAYNTDHAIIARQGSNITAANLETLYNKKIGVAFGTSSELYVKGVLDAAGKDSSKLNLINMTPQDAISALASGAIDALAFWEPIPSNALKKIPGSYLVIRGQSTFKNVGTILSTKSYVEKNGEAIKRFLVAAAESQQWIRGHKAEASEIASHWASGLDKEVALMAIDAISFDMRVSKNSIDALNYMMDLLDKQGKLKKFNLDNNLMLKYNQEVQKEYPQYFKDLPPIPQDKQL
ncbi:ABC transporter substrate-binding protein [Moorella naiadis]|uniref:ABC transporter substrate-binding protein n=1 Tax=Moorella naiadis (nom. illeg.) TaxID=3093670 RepID=UPI003D9C99DB